MRTSIVVAGVLLATPAAAHDSAEVIAGEEPVEHTHVGEDIWNLFLPEAEAAADFTVDGAYRRIRANGYPVKAPGQFPNRNNPHSISKKNYNLKVPLEPRKNNQPTANDRGVFGIAINGVLFDPATAEYWQNNRRSGWRYEALGGACKLGLDSYNAHVQPDGTYHYHGIPTGVVAASGGNSAPALIGYAADGFPIYGPKGYSNPQAPSSLKTLKSSYRVKSGARSSGPGGRYNGKFTQDWTYVAGAGDLDQCNGRFAVTPEYPNGTYHYVLTEDFPVIPRCWMGTPDSSFTRLHQGGNRGGPQRGGLDDGGTEEDAMIDFADYNGDEDLPVELAQARPGHPPRLLPGGRPPQGAGRGPGRDGPGNRPQGGGQRQGRGPCSGS